MRRRKETVVPGFDHKNNITRAPAKNKSAPNEIFLAIGGKRSRPALAAFQTSDRGRA